MLDVVGGVLFVDFLLFNKVLCYCFKKEEKKMLDYSSKLGVVDIYVPA